MDRYPADFAAAVKNIASEVHFWAEAQALADGHAADLRLERIEHLTEELKKQQVLHEDSCQQIHDMAITATAVTLCQVFHMAGLQHREEEFKAACEPHPEEVSTGLWRRTQDLFWAAARLACAEASGKDADAQKHQQTFERHARFIAGFGKVSSGRGVLAGAAAYATKAADVIHGSIITFSGCRDAQMSGTSSSSSGLPSSAGPGGAGGACANSLIQALADNAGVPSWAVLLEKMQRHVAGTHKQILQLSSSRQMDLQAHCSLKNPSGQGRCRALLVGINYAGANCELKGSHNNVETMRRYLEENGFRGNDVRIFMDDGHRESPVKANIISGMQWLTQDAAPGDSLFFHYSGHGTSARDDNGDNADGLDQGLCPLDTESNGLLRDDEVFRYLMAPLQKGVHLTAVLDCCHGGAIVELPYCCRADTSTLQVQTQPNGDFDFGKVLQVIQEHPGSCAGAASVGATASGTTVKENRGKLGHAIMRFSENL